MDHAFGDDSTANSAAHRASVGRVESTSRILIESDPEVLEFPFSSLGSFITPTEQFYVRSHFSVPSLDLASWRIRVEGAVERPLELSYDDLRSLPSRTVPVTLECAGNSRTFLHPRVAGAQWGLGAVSTAEWTGVPLAALLERVGLSPSALEVVLEGADRGTVSETPKPAGEISYARSLPRLKALQPDVLLAYKMNGEDLPLSHGFPLRAIIPGWYGMASVKWLTRVVVVEVPFQGYWQTVDYAFWERRNALPTRTPLTEMQVKSEIAQPASDEIVPAGIPYRVRGAAWTSDAEVTQVEVSTDAGDTWNDARLIGPSAPHTWRLWEYSWRTPAQPGRYTLLSRARDSRGRIQPVTHDPDRANYMITHILPVEVEVELR